MLEVLNLKIPIEADQESKLMKKLSRILKVSPGEIRNMEVLKKSIDARKKPDLYFTYSVALSLPKDREEKILFKKVKDVRPYQPKVYTVEKAGSKPGKRPVVIGAGPAGIFAALVLSHAGLCPILLERGKPIEERTEDVKTFFRTGILDPESNVQFGEGGAGAFSDGKLNTQVNDRDGRNRYVLCAFVRHGADPMILTDPKPHVGTDRLFYAVSGIRREIEEAGGEVRFGSKVTGFEIKDGHLRGLIVNDQDYIETDDAILAPGHSARDTFKVLLHERVPIAAKPFAVGFRVEHPQEWLDIAQYGRVGEDLPPASYHLAAHLSSGRSIYSFCMCPGGYVINCSTEADGLLVNGMSYSGRDSANANAAIVLSVGEGEFDMNDPEAGIRYQRQLEKKAFALGGGRIPQQLLRDFVKGKESTEYETVVSLTKGETCFADLRSILGDKLNQDMYEGFHLFDHKIRGFYREDAVLSGVESRTSSPVRIPRGKDGMSEIKGIYPAGEGAGYAGGIMSAAMDGMKAAEHVLERLKA